MSYSRPSRSDLPPVRYECLGSDEFGINYMKQNDGFRGWSFRAGGTDHDDPIRPLKGRISLPPVQVVGQKLLSPSVMLKAPQDTPGPIKFSVFYFVSPAYITHVGELMYGKATSQESRPGNDWDAKERLVVGAFRLKFHLFQSLNEEVNFAVDEQFTKGSLRYNIENLNEPPPQDFVALLNNPKRNGDGTRNELGYHRETLLLTPKSERKGLLTGWTRGEMKAVLRYMTITQGLHMAALDEIATYLNRNELVISGAPSDGGIANFKLGTRFSNRARLDYENSVWRLQKSLKTLPPQSTEEEPDWVTQLQTENIMRYPADLTASMSKSLGRPAI